MYSRRPRGRKTAPRQPAPPHRQEGPRSCSARFRYNQTIASLLRVATVYDFLSFFPVGLLIGPIPSIVSRPSTLPHSFYLLHSLPPSNLDPPAAGGCGGSIRAATPTPAQASPLAWSAPLGSFLSWMHICLNRDMSAWLGDSAWVGFRVRVVCVCGGGGGGGVNGGALRWMGSTL
jgi:hypothetical protein